MTKLNQPEPNKNEQGILSSWNKKFEQNLDMWFWLFLGLFLILAFIFFDPKVSIGGDDSEYINRAFSFIKKGQFPTFQGPLYPVVLGIIISIAGLKLTMLKIASILFMLIHFRLFYLTFKKHLPSLLLVSLLFMLAINASMLYFASATYTESFFLMIQSLFLFVFEKYFISQKKEKYAIKEDYKKFLLLGLCVFLMAITKNIGLTAIIGVMLFFAIRLKWIAIGFTLAAFLLFFGAFSLVKKYGYNVDSVQMSSQGSTLMLKHPYDPSKGKEDFSGFVNRIVVNSQEYLSKHFTTIFGLNKESKPKSSGFITLLMYAILFSGYFVLFKKSDFWAFVGTYLIASCGISFIVLQTYWSQERLILVYVPLLLVFLFFSIYYLIGHYKKDLSWLFIVILLIFLGSDLIRTARKLPTAVNSLGHYLAGESTYGFTPDWINYFEMSKWVKKNLPENTVVACRKPGMAFIYSGGKEFYGIWKVPSEDADELYQKLKDADVTYVMVASLRLDPTRNTGRTINTIRRYLSIIHNAYPDKLEFVYKIGEEEPVFLYKLN